MNYQEIHFIIDSKGQITTTVKGVEGKACVPLAAEWETLGTVLSRQRTGDFYRESLRLGLEAGLFHGDRAEE